MTTEILTCPQCNQKFQLANRAKPDTPPGSEAQIIYCSVACKRKAGNRRYYEEHRQEVISKVIIARKKWHFVPFNRQAVFLGKSEKEAKEMIEQIAESRE